jgi:hypothetical protein
MSKQQPKDSQAIKDDEDDNCQFVIHEDEDAYEEEEYDSEEEEDSEVMRTLKVCDPERIALWRKAKQILKEQEAVPKDIKIPIENPKEAEEVRITKKTYKIYKELLRIELEKKNEELKKKYKEAQASLITANEKISKLKKDLSEAKKPSVKPLTLSEAKNMQSVEPSPLTLSAPSSEEDSDEQDRPTRDVLHECFADFLNREDVKTALQNTPKHKRASLVKQAFKDETGLDVSYTWIYRVFNNKVKKLKHIKIGTGKYKIIPL